MTPPCNGCDLCLPTNEQGLCSKCAQPPRDKAVASADHMHPTGRCTCAGEGTCEWCADAAAREVDHPADAPVQSPRHYKVHSIEPIDVIESWRLGLAAVAGLRDRVAGGAVLIRIPGLRLVNGSNERGVTWQAMQTKRKRIAEQRLAAARWVLVEGGGKAKVPALLPAIVTITRVAPSDGLDIDGLWAATKPVRDGVADAFGLRDDSDPRITWRVDQYRGRPREYACEILVEPRTEGAIAVDSGTVSASTSYRGVRHGACVAVYDRALGEAWAWMDPPQLRALIVQLEIALAACVAAERAKPR